MTDIVKRAEKFLGVCGSCDAGLPVSCTCPEEDFRPVMLDLVREVEQLREAELDRKNPRYRIKSGAHAGKVGRRIHITQKVHPFNRYARVYEIEFPDGERVKFWAEGCERL